MTRWSFYLLALRGFNAQYTTSISSFTVTTMRNKSSRDITYCTGIKGRLLLMRPGVDPENELWSMRLGNNATLYHRKREKAQKYHAGTVITLSYIYRTLSDSTMWCSRYGSNNNKKSKVVDKHKEFDNRIINPAKCIPSKSCFCSREHRGQKQKTRARCAFLRTSRHAPIRMDKNFPPRRQWHLLQ